MDDTPRQPIARNAQLQGLDPQQITVISVLVGLGLAGLRKMWVFGWTYTDKETDLAEMTKDRDFWRDTALKAMGHVDQALGGPAEGKGA